MVKYKEEGMVILFSKFTALGNDFILIDNIKQNLNINFSKLAERLCDRNFSIGADGLLILSKSKNYDFKMRIFNKDSSEAEMCGNGIRCLAYYLYQKGYTKSNQINIETKAGKVIPNLIIKNNKISSIAVNMGNPKEIKNLELRIKNNKINGTFVSIGNPHFVIFVNDLNKINIEELGKEIEYHKIFKNRTNVEFVKVIDKDNITIRVWERGVGETLSCGSGACASAIASSFVNLTNRKVNVYLKGGLLKVRWQDNNNIIMEGKVSHIFDGQVYL